MSNLIFRNALKTPDGTIIESFYRHDYVTHEDANGETYMVDGGHNYLKRSSNKIPAEDLTTVEIKGDHEYNRQHFRWGTYGKRGDEPLRLVVLMDISTPHIKAILDSQHLDKDVINMFEEEIKYRAENK